MKGTEIKKRLSQKFDVKSSSFSARLDSYSMGQSYYVDIHIPTVSREEVDNFVSHTLDLESVRRCSSTGDILSGGNTFVNVKYSQRALEGDLNNEIILNRFFAFLKTENLIKSVIDNPETTRETLSDFMKMKDLNPELISLKGNDCDYLTRTDILNVLQARLRVFYESQRLENQERD